jgi:Spy/CpxP family protein refolding chaperone
MKRMMVVVVVLMTGVALVWAQPARQKGPEGRMLQKMNLTEEQQDQVADLRLEMAKKQIDLNSKEATARVELRQLLREEKMDRAAIEKKTKEIAGYAVDEKMMKLDHWSTVNKLLTPEQQKTWKHVLLRASAQQPGRNREGGPEMRQRRGRGAVAPPVPPAPEP